MRVAVIGSRNSRGLTVEDIIQKIPKNCTELVSGGAIGVDRLARQAAKRLDLPLIEYRPIMPDTAARPRCTAMPRSYAAPIWCWLSGIWTVGAPLIPSWSASAAGSPLR